MGKNFNEMLVSSNKLSGAKKSFQKKLIEALNRKRILEISKKRSNPTIKKNFLKEKRKVFKAEEKKIKSIDEREKIKNNLTTLVYNTIKINLEKGSFNGSIIKNEDHYICVYRKTEKKIAACRLREDFSVVQGSNFDLIIENATDPRLLKLNNNKIVMSYSTTGSSDREVEYTAGNIVFDGERFVNNKSFRISPISDYRQKNWMPFTYHNKIFYISSICPHSIYELNIEKHNINCRLAYETTWNHPWFENTLRGNTNCIRLNDENYLTTFHTATWYGEKCYYDNGAYIFEGKPPFKVIKCAKKTFLKAEDAIETHFRKHQKRYLMCTFPISINKDKDEIIISYGDNDSCIKISKLKIDDLINTMVSVG